MKRITFLLIPVMFLFSCGGRNEPGTGTVSVSIAPFKYFVDEISGGSFEVNVMVPAGANPHIYEPFPGQIAALRKSEAYISNGVLGFEMAWLERFYEINRNMKKLSLGDSIEPLEADHDHSGEHSERADPHYWMSPKCAMKMAGAVKDLLISLDAERSGEYNVNYMRLLEKIVAADSMAAELSLIPGSGTFMIYHPNLAYLARDYGLTEIAVEHDGKEPSPSRLRDLIDIAGREKIKTILVQKEYDPRNAEAVAGETGAKVVAIDPLSADWYSTVTGIISLLKSDFEEALKTE